VLNEEEQLDGHEIISFGPAVDDMDAPNEDDEIKEDFKRNVQLEVSLSPTLLFTMWIGAVLSICCISGTCWWYYNKTVTSRVNKKRFVV